MKNISIIGTGYVGLVTGVSLASLGHHVVCVGRDRKKADLINTGQSPFYEPGLNVLVKKLIKKKKLSASIDLTQSVLNSSVTIIAVGTPTIHNKIDLTAIKKVSREIGVILKQVERYHVVVVKSTVVPGTTERIVKPLLEQYSGKGIGEFGLCMNPEFLREGNAVFDALNPDRIVVGQYDKTSGKEFLKLYEQVTVPKIITNLRTAEMIKYTSNAIFATLVSFSNEIARICEESRGVDVKDVWEAVHLDNRLTPIVNKKRIVPGVVNYLYSGCGYGGSCFPKDTKALYSYASSLGIEAGILENVIKTNETQPLRLVELLKSRMKNIAEKKITILGLSFKPNTDDVRESPAFTVIQELLRLNAIVTVHDPVVNIADHIFRQKVKQSATVAEALHDAEAAIIATSWDAYKAIKPEVFKKAMKIPFIVDGRRIYDRAAFEKAGIFYLGIGLRDI